MFGHLSSIPSRSMTEWVISWTNTSESLWIGLRDNGQGGWSWVDNRPVSFTYWANNEPNNLGDEGEECIEMYPDGKWNDNDCKKVQGYMCTVPKVIGTDENGNVIHYQTEAPPTDSNTAVIVGAILGSIAALLLIAGVAYYYHKNGGFNIKSVSSGGQSGFDNSLYSKDNSKDETTTVDIPGLSNA